MKKGDLVKLNPNDPEIIRILGWEPDPDSTSYMASRPATHEEREEWRQEKYRAIAEARAAGEDTFHIAMNDAGESRLAPMSTSIPLPINDIYIVERARCRVSLGWGNPEPGMARILNTKTGEHAYVKREMLMVIV
jgi:hypothetical protein